ncbi:MAG: 4-alpha-glucanotransferase [Planctomycetota bacterium]
MARRKTTEAFTFDRRSSGVLLHPTSLPGPHPTGDIGAAAYAFVDWLARAGQRWWQMLPTGPIDFAGSPYSGFSAFAFNPLLIDLQGLYEDGLLPRAAVKSVGKRGATRVDFDANESFRLARLRQASQNFFTHRRGRAAFDRFCAAEAQWLDGAALFFAIRESCGRRPWWAWDTPLRRRRTAALREAAEHLADDVRLFKFTQYIADLQWGKLRKYANQRGIGLIGDLPIFVSHDSSDVWEQPELFTLKPDGTCRVVSGAAPDDFSPIGQLWGHPLYRWNVHRKTGYDWWTRRFARLFTQFDGVRIDHFLGFNRYWEVPGDAETAVAGRWKQGPRHHFFATVLPALEKLGCNGQIIAEDLGLLIPAAERLRDDFEFPGMRVIQFGFGQDDGYHLPHNCPPRSIAYTGTHDNDTVVGWWKGASKDERRRALTYTGGTGKTIAEDLVRVVSAGPANVSVFPMQDLLGLGRSARMNVPGTTGGANWRWRLRPGQTSAAVADKLSALASLTGRL